VQSQHSQQAEEDPNKALAILSDSGRQGPILTRSGTIKRLTQTFLGLQDLVVMLDLDFFVNR